MAVRDSLQFTVYRLRVVFLLLPTSDMSRVKALPVLTQFEISDVQFFKTKKWKGVTVLKRSQNLFMRE